MPVPTRRPTPFVRASRRTFLAQATAFAVVAPSVARAAQPADAAAPLFAYVGTYSSPPDAPGRKDPPTGNGRGIHIFRVDRDTGTLAPSGIADHFTSPSALAIDATGSYMYRALEYSLCFMIPPER